MSASLLLVDDDRTVRETLAEFFDALGFRTRAATGASEARRLAAADAPDVALVDLRLPDADGITLLHALRADDPDLSVILLTGHGDVPTAVRAMREGAIDFLEKPVDLDTLEAAVRRALEIGRLRREVHVLRAHRDAPEASPPSTPTLERMVELAARNLDAPVLIVGETGTGKGFIAHRIHELSANRQAPFVEINCASLSSTFFESELFGHEKGAFTDARQAKRGLLEVAGRGTVFLDEVGELAPEVQPKLLKVLEERTFRRLGGTAELHAECRVIAATNQPLAERVTQGRFRADLFFRLQVLTITLPSLRERPADIEPLARALLPREASLTSRAIHALQRYSWPGNVRELKNALWRAAIVAEGAPIEPEHLGLGESLAVGAEEDRRSPVTLAEAEQRAIEAALRATQGNKARAAQLLGISRSTLAEKLKRASATHG